MNRITIVLPKTPVQYALIVVFLGLFSQLRGQDLKYDPKGNPGKWNFEITPFFVLPGINGQVQSERLSEDFQIGPSDFISALYGAFMLDAEISKGKFFLSPSWVYTHNAVEKELWTSEDGTQSISFDPGLKRHILEMKAGMRFRLADDFILDPYAGFRYTNYNLFGSVEGIINTDEIDEHADFWDPIIGIQAHYYPHPRVPIELKADLGGFGVGSELTWSAWINSGYAVSPIMDIIAGYAVLENRYETETRAGNAFGMSSLTHGFTMGLRFYLAKRYEDPAVFKKAKQ